jgi:hypothetical protein
MDEGCNGKARDQFMFANPDAAFVALVERAMAVGGGRRTASTPGGADLANHIGDQVLRRRLRRWRKARNERSGSAAAADDGAPQARPVSAVLLDGDELLAVAGAANWLSPGQRQ